MTDRVPTYPGRVRLTPVAGQENVYDLTLADDAIEQGTPLNKANLLTDATAALLELSGAGATVNGALAVLAAAASSARTDIDSILDDLPGKLEIIAYGSRQCDNQDSFSISLPREPDLVVFYVDGIAYSSLGSTSWAWQAPLVVSPGKNSSGFGHWDGNSYPTYYMSLVTCAYSNGELTVNEASVRSKRYDGVSSASSFPGITICNSRSDRTAHYIAIAHSAV